MYYEIAVLFSGNCKIRVGFIHPSFFFFCAFTFIVNILYSSTTFIKIFFFYLFDAFVLWCLKVLFSCFSFKSTRGHTMTWVFRLKENSHNRIWFDWRASVSHMICVSVEFREPSIMLLSPRPIVKNWPKRNRLKRKRLLYSLAGFCYTVIIQKCDHSVFFFL